MPSPIRKTFIHWLLSRVPSIERSRCNQPSYNLSGSILAKDTIVTPFSMSNRSRPARMTVPRFPVQQSRLSKAVGFVARVALQPEPVDPALHRNFSTRREPKACSDRDVFLFARPSEQCQKINLSNRSCRDLPPETHSLNRVSFSFFKTV